MSQVNVIQEVLDVLTDVATEFKSVRSEIQGAIATQGDLSSLSTSAKNSLVASLNELDSKLSALTQIDDSAASITKTYSSEKITQLNQQLKAEILGNVPEAFDTLQELLAQLSEDENQIQAILTALANRLRFDAPQTLTAEQRAQGLANLGAVSRDEIGDTSVDLVAAFRAALQ